MFEVIGKLTCGYFAVGAVVTFIMMVIEEEVRRCWERGEGALLVFVFIVTTMFWPVALYIDYFKKDPT